MIKKTGMQAMVALAMTGALTMGSAQAIEVTGYGTLGLGSDSGYDTGPGIKLGADVGQDLFGVENLAATGFIALTQGKDDSVSCDYKVRHNSLAVGATYSYALDGTRWTFQGRAYPLLDNRKYTVDCGGGDASSSDTNISAGVGVSAQYEMNDRLSLRGDLDVLAGYWRFISVGVQFKLF
jgi:hypothetical protein